MAHTNTPALAATSLGTISAEVMSITFESLFHADTAKKADAGAESEKLDRGLAISLAGEPSYQLVVAWATSHEPDLHELFMGDKPAGHQQTMVKDALGETINIVAGQIKSQLALDHALSLPKNLNATQLQDWRSRDMQNSEDGVWLQAGAHQARVRLTFRTDP